MENRIVIICGHYGSGKTEFAINYALNKVGNREKTVLVDLDIIDPYFRSREAGSFLEKQGIKVIGSSLGDTSYELPAISSEIFSTLRDKTNQTIIDLGGNETGAKVLGRFKDNLNKDSYEMLFVVNAKRPMTNTPEKAADLLRSIEKNSRQNVTAIVNNTHLCGGTQLEDILSGQELCSALSEKTGLPIAYTVVREELKDCLIGKIHNEIFTISPYLKKPWELG